MDREDPASQFFPGQEDVDLYAVLSLDSNATSDDIKKAYRRLALRYHPDKHASSSDEARAESSVKFQQVGFAYTVLNDEKRRSRYDKTGRTDEGFDLQAGEDGWEAYFADMFDSVTKGKLDEMKKEYQGSQEEADDLKRAFMDTDNTIGEIMSHIPHSTFNDEARFIATITQLIKDGELPKSKMWDKSVKDEKAKLVRQKQAEKEAGEAEELAKELGVWDEFYGSGKTGKRKGKGKQSAADADASNEEDYSALQALILKKNQNRGAALFDNLAAKYADAEPKRKGGKGRKRANENDDGQAQAGKKSKTVPNPPEIDDEEFEKLQQKLFGGKDQRAAGGESVKTSNGRRSKRS